MNVRACRADVLDQVHEYIALLLLVASLALGCGLIQDLLGDSPSPLVKYLSWAFKGLGTLLLLKTVWLLIQKWRLRDAGDYSDSFTNQIVHKAAAVSWMVGMVALTLDNRVFSTIPVEGGLEFMSESVRAAMCASYGIAFLILNRIGGEETGVL